MFLSVYPDFCENYYGPHPTECLETMWNSSKCLPQGYLYPDKLDSNQHSKLDATNIRLKFLPSDIYGCLGVIKHLLRLGKFPLNTSILHQRRTTGTYQANTNAMDLVGCQHGLV